MRGFAQLTKISQTVTVPGIPSGTRKLFDQDIPPTGWTRVTASTLDDSLVRVVVGPRTPSGGSWVVSGLTSASHSHTVADPISHNHSVSVASHYHKRQLWIESGSGNCTYNFHTEEYRGSRSKTASLSVATTGTSPAPTSSVAASVVSDGSWRPLYRDIIIAQKE